MAARHELEIEIGPDGNIRVHVKGAKGHECLDYVQIFAEIGRVQDKQMTSEYYEPSPPVTITGETKTRIDGRSDKA